MRYLKLISLCLLLSACVFGTSQTSKFYTLTSQSNEALSRSYKSFVGISRIQLPKYVDRPQIVTQKADSNEVMISEYNRWLEGPSILATRALTENLSALLPTAQIKMRQAVAEKFNMIVTVEVIKMNAVLGEQVELDAWYIIKDKSDRILCRQKFTGAVKIGKSYNDLAAGFSLLLNRLSQEIARSLIKGG